MNMIRSKSAPEGAFLARQVPATPEALEAYFSKVASYEADRLKSANRTARIGFMVGAIGLVTGALGVGGMAAMAPLKTVLPVVFRVDNATGAVERVYDLQGGNLAASEATTRYFLWQYVRYRQTYSPQEAQATFTAVTLMSSPAVQNEYAAAFRGSNPTSPQVVLGRDGSASVRFLSTSLLGPKLAQVRFIQQERKGETLLPPKRMVATIAFDFAPGQVTTNEINVNPQGFIVTSYRADVENAQ